jgi:hypothetical protein
MATGQWLNAAGAGLFGAIFSDLKNLDWWWPLASVALTVLGVWLTFYHPWLSARCRRIAAWWVRLRQERLAA